MRHVALVALSLLALAAEAAAQSRIALVIGNARYATAPLSNPVNDARALGLTLGELGFDVTTVLDASRRAMEEAVLDFAARLNADTAAVFYFAGHGIQSRGRNYLMPVDATFKGERELRFEGLDVGFVLEELELAGSRVSFVILDACRNNPFASKYRGIGRGLSAVDAARGTLIAYATAPGSVAADGEAAHGLYSGELLEALKIPGLKAEEVFKRVRVAVSQRSGGSQIPWESSSLTGDFVFHRGVEGARAQPGSAHASAAMTTSGASAEVTFWESVRHSDDRRMFEAYLRRYPNGTFAEIAHLRLEQLGARDVEGAPSTGAPNPAPSDGTARAPTQASRSGHCADVSGSWRAITPGALCEATVYLEGDGENGYRFAQDGCGDARGSAALNGSELTIRWSQALCAGHSVYRLDDNCTMAVGEVVLETNFLLCTGRHASSLQRIGDDTYPPGRD